MPLRLIGGKRYATLWIEDVVLPGGTPTITGPEPRWRFIRSVRVSVLRYLVLEEQRACSRAFAAPIPERPKAHKRVISF
jgi:hypothetical protein